MLMTSIIVTNSKLPNSVNKTIGIINSAKHFPNITVGTLNGSNFYGDSIYNLGESLEIQTQTYCKPFQGNRVYFRHYAAVCMPSF